MIKKNKVTMIVTSIIILLPIIFGVFLFEKLPEQIAVHWGVSGEPDGFAPKWVAVFVLPVILLAFQWLCAFVTGLDKKSRAQSEIMQKLVLWIIPIINLVMNFIVYATAFEIKLNVGLILLMFFGVFFIVVGNFLPKCTQNSFIGIKTSATLQDIEVWNKTHRLAGILWVISGVVTMFLALLNLHLVALPILIIMVLVPVIYSYVIRKK